MKTVVRELRGEILQLFTHHRGGVISAALAAALRTGTGQVELSKALSAAIRQLPLNKQVQSSAIHRLLRHPMYATGAHLHAQKPELKASPFILVTV